MIATARLAREGWPDRPPLPRAYLGIHSEGADPSGTAARWGILTVDARCLNSP